jgi:hypothetical protein
MRSIFLSALLLCAGAAFAQTPATPPPPQYGWKQGLTAGLTLTQVSFTDWAQGGSNALSYTIFANGQATEEEEGSNWTNIYKFAFGQTRLGDQGLRKTDDAIDLSTVYTYKIGGAINPYAGATLKTQFAKGFAYNADGTSVEISKFFDPAYLTQAVGAIYQPQKEITTRLGLGLREVLTSDFNQYTDDPTTPEIEKTTVDAGIESVTNVDWHLEENILLTSQLQLFDAFKHMDEVIARGSLSITGKVNKYISASFGLEVVNEKRVSPRTQVKESIALGLSYTVF